MAIRARTSESDSDVATMPIDTTNEASRLPSVRFGKHASFAEGVRNRFRTWIYVGPIRGPDQMRSAVLAFAGKNASIASSDKVMSRGVPNTVVVLKNASSPAFVRRR